MKETTGQIKFDTVLSTSLFPAGWMKYAHPLILNRDTLFQWILNQLDDDSMDNKLRLYPRNMFEYRADKTKNITKVLAIDGAFEHKTAIMEFLSSIKWEGYYADIEFIPFQTNDDFIKQDQIEPMDNHNTFCASIASEFITVKNPGYVLNTSETLSFTFLDWLASKTNNSINVFYEVEQISVTKLVIAYFERNSEIVKDFLTNIQQLLRDDYHDDAVAKVFGAGLPQPRRSGLCDSFDFFKRMIDKNFSVNSYTTKMNRKPGRMFYGREPAEETPDDAKLFGTISYKNATTGSTSDNDDSEIERLTGILNDLQNQLNSLRQDITADVSKQVLVDVDKKNYAAEARANDRIDQVEKTWNSDMDKLAKQMAGELYLRVYYGITG